MAKDSLLNISVDTNKITRLKTKLVKYPPNAIKAGLKAAEDYLNDDQFKMSMYPPSQSGSPFEWSSDKQRKAFFASDGFGGGIPTQRTYELAQQGVFSMNEGYLTVEYQNYAPYNKFVISSNDVIIGHRKRGWQPVNKFVVAKSKDIAKVFEKAVKETWARMESLMFGGGGGL
jgi:hypothetical protein